MNDVTFAFGAAWTSNYADGTVSRIDAADGKVTTIAVGSDADIALWDPKRKVTIRHELIHDGADYTPYEGLEVTGWPVLTMVRGKVVVDDGVLVGAKGHGTYLPRAKPPAGPDSSQR